MDSFNFLDKEDTYSMALLMLYASSDNPRFSTLSELVYLLDSNSFKNFIKYYEGQTIQVPTAKEIQDSLRLLILFQHSKVEKMEWHEALRESGFSQEESISARTKLGMMCDNIRKYHYRLGGLLGKKDEKVKDDDII